MPSLRAVKSFVAAAKYGSFTRAAEALCVTQAAISRQIRELEEYLGADLFIRSGRAVKLSAEGSAFFDAAQLSFINISRAADRIHAKATSNKSLTICCSYAFSSLWLQPRLAAFTQAHPDIDLRVIAAQDFAAIESSVRPDVFITKLSQVRAGYGSIRLFHDRIYPVCSPDYLAAHPGLDSLEAIRHADLLDLNPYGRSQLAEHVDWAIWLAFHGVQLPARGEGAGGFFSSNDYNVLVHLALDGRGIALGWHHLVAPLVDSGRLVRPVEQEVAHRETCHFLSILTEREGDEVCTQFRDWVLTQG